MYQTGLEYFRRQGNIRRVLQRYKSDGFLVRALPVMTHGSSQRSSRKEIEKCSKQKVEIYNENQYNELEKKIYKQIREQTKIDDITEEIRIKKWYLSEQNCRKKGNRWKRVTDWEITDIQYPNNGHSLYDVMKLSK